MLTTFCLASALSAFGASVVELPPGEDRDAWRQPLELAGLEAGLAGAEAHIEVRVVGDVWVVRAMDPPSPPVEVRIAPPRNDSAREDFAWLALGLLSASPERSFDAPPPSPPRAVAATAPPVAVAPPPPLAGTEPLVVTAPSPSLAPTVDTPPPTIAPSPPLGPAAAAETVVVERATSLRLSLDGGTAVSIRGGVMPSPSVWVGLEQRLAGGFSAGVLVEWRPWAELADLQALDSARWFWAIDGLARLDWTGPTTVAPTAGLALGASRRAYRQADFVAAHTVPLAAGSVGVVLPTRYVSIVPRAAVEVDLARTLLVAYGTEAAFSPMLVSLGVGFRSRGDPNRDVPSP